MEIDTIIKEIKNTHPNIIGECLKEVFQKHSTFDEDELIYHYTSIDAIVNGIIVNEPDPNREICLRATRCTHLNDKDELKSGLELIKGACEEIPQIYDGLKEMHRSSCSISFCRNADSLPMWNMYGRNGNGVMLAFDTNILNKMYKHRFLHCIYADTEYDLEVLEKFTKSDFGKQFKLSASVKFFIFYLLCAVYVSLRKNRAFEYEDEFRIIGIGNKFFEGETPTLYRTAKDIIVPYTNVFFPKNALKGVWMGPTNNEDLSVATMKEFLESKGFDIPVERSKIPYRG